MQEEAAAQNKVGRERGNVKNSVLVWVARMLTEIFGFEEGIKKWKLKSQASTRQSFSETIF